MSEFAEEDRLSTEAYWEREYDDVSRAYDEVVAERDSLLGVVQAVREWAHTNHGGIKTPAEVWPGLAALLAEPALAAAADAPQPARPSVPPPEPGVRACCGDTHLGDGCDPDAGPSPAVLPGCACGRTDEHGPHDD